MRMDDDGIFKALADPTRRHLLDRLFERDGRTLTELESELEMTRFGVMKHLRVLEDAAQQVHRAPRCGARRPQARTGGDGMTTMTAQATQVFIKATPEDGGFSLLTVTHDRLDASPKTAAGVAGGWMFVLSGLKTLLETGEPLAG
jgi:hypothetical protein